MSKAQLVRFVLNYLQIVDDNEAADVACDGLNNGIDIVNTEEWQWSLTSTSVTFTAGDDTPEIPANVKRPRKLWLNNSTPVRVTWLNYESPKVFVDRWTDATQNGEPQQYTIINANNALQMRLSHPPSAGWVTNYPTGTFWFYARIAHLNGDADVLDAPPEITPFIGWYARWELASVRGAPATVIDRAYAHWNNIFNRLRRDNTRLMTEWSV